MTYKNKGSMMRVSDKLVEDLKLLKEVKSLKGKLGTHSNLVHNLIKAELRKTHADTQDGFLAEGCVVLGPSDNPVVIKSVGKSKVVFNDDTYMINGSPACTELELLAESIEEFNGGVFNA